MSSVHNQNPVRVLIFSPRCHILIVCQVWLKTCNTVCMGKKIRRRHVTLALITDVQSIVENKDGVEEDVTSVNCASGICEVSDKPGQL